MSPLFSINCGRSHVASKISKIRWIGAFCGNFIEALHFQEFLAYVGESDNNADPDYG